MKTVFTNGCFDIIHPGHIDLLERARAFGDRLVVGINSDASVRAIKGGGRPFMDEASRKQVLEGLSSVDEVVVFDELTPERTIHEIKPDVLVKGGDWRVGEIVGSEFILGNGGEVYSLPLLGTFSSSSVVEKIRDSVVTPIDAKDEPIDTTSDRISAISLTIADARDRSQPIAVRSDESTAPEANYFAELLKTIGVSLLDEGPGEQASLALVLSSEADPQALLTEIMVMRSVGTTIISFTTETAKKVSSISDMSVIAPGKKIEDSRVFFLKSLQELLRGLR